MESKNQYAVVTGGTSGIGYELARLLAKDGYNLILAARHEQDLIRVSNELKTEFGIDVISISKDLFVPANAFELYNDVKTKNLGIEILINDAGQGQYGEFLDTDLQRELDIINLNISSLVILTKLFLRDMVAQGHGRIMNLSSIASKMPGPWQSVYHGTKAFVQSFTEAVRSEVKDKGVTITALLPGATDTDFFNKADMNDSKIVQEGKLDNAADAAKDGYEAMMNGDDMVVSGMKNKMQVAMSNVTPDGALADKMKKQQGPAREKKEKQVH
ncbi:SDR family oxidoreductase [Fulvivirgaceae bacterium PWU5]|uniref:SDR family oxidoreductase n=1 Tax=Dawidia cretensis TaxID=2782350 RepID=A0AAP2E3M2_9BACT|nr:SDR family oxidoreductase [Dawidia cretensis]MBT1711453.1 SDR family oxidoreductase [Dawidia cretensis]